MTFLLLRHTLLLFLLRSRCLDILELSEHEDLRKFHYHTLKLYCALCALGNTRVAHALCSHLDQSQLLYTIDNQYLSGMLREGFYNVLIRCVVVTEIILGSIINVVVKFTVLQCSDLTTSTWKEKSKKSWQYPCSPENLMMINDRMITYYTISTSTINC